MYICVYLHAYEVFILAICPPWSQHMLCLFVISLLAVLFSFSLAR